MPIIRMLSWGVEIIFHDEGEFDRWFGRLGPTDKVRVLQAIDKLQVSATPIGMPHGRRLSRNIWELRPQSGRSSLRIYYGVSGGMAHLLAFGTKDTQRRDIDRARGRQ